MIYKENSKQIEIRKLTPIVKNVCTIKGRMVSIWRYDNKSTITIAFMDWVTGTGLLCSTVRAPLIARAYMMVVSATTSLIDTTVCALVRLSNFVKN